MGYQSTNPNREEGRETRDCSPVLLNELVDFMLRKPAVAGRFYPADKITLQSDLVGYPGRCGPTSMREALSFSRRIYVLDMSQERYTPG
jgi:hypothetical protein